MSETRMWCSVEVAGNVYKMLADYLKAYYRRTKGAASKGNEFRI